jgi:hypothetical protein
VGSGSIPQCLLLPLLLVCRAPVSATLSGRHVHLLQRHWMPVGPRCPARDAAARGGWERTGMPNACDADGTASAMATMMTASHSPATRRSGRPSPSASGRGTQSLTRSDNYLVLL